MDTITVDPLYARLTEEKDMGIEGEDVRLGSDLSTATATLTVYDSSGAAVAALTAVSATIAGTTKIRITYFTTFGAGKNVTAAGTYRAEWRVTKGTTIRVVQQPWYVSAAPS